MTVTQKTCFLVNPKTRKIELANDEESTGLLVYRYNPNDVKDSDIRQMLTLVKFTLGSLEDVSMTLDPWDSGKIVDVFLCIKNRSNIKLGQKYIK